MFELKHDYMLCTPEGLQETVRFIDDHEDYILHSVTSQSEAPLSASITSYKIIFIIKT